jgi:hypothetical protein
MKLQKKVRELQNKNVINFFTRKNINDSPINLPDTDWEELVRTKTVDLVQLILWALKEEHKINVPKEFDPGEEQFTKDVTMISMCIKGLLEHQYGIGPTETTRVMENMAEKIFVGPIK